MKILQSLLAIAFLGVLVSPLQAGYTGSNPFGDNDGDGVVNELDNCIFVLNSDQLDLDLDELGNACDTDDDGDDVPDSLDTAPLDSSRS